MATASSASAASAAKPSTSRGNVLVVRVVGFRNIHESSLNGSMFLRCKLNFRNICFKSSLVNVQEEHVNNTLSAKSSVSEKSQRNLLLSNAVAAGSSSQSRDMQKFNAGDLLINPVDDETKFSAKFEPGDICVFTDWGLDSSDTLSAEELLMVRVDGFDSRNTKSKLFRQKQLLGTVSIALKDTAKYGMSSNGFWFPLHPLHASSSSPPIGEMLICIFWTKALLLRSRSSKIVNSPVRNQIFNTESVSPSPTTSSGKPNGFEEAKREKLNYFKINKETQEYLVSIGYSPFGLSPISPGVDIVDLLTLSSSREKLLLKGSSKVDLLSSQLNLKKTVTGTPRSLDDRDQIRNKSPIYTELFESLSTPRHHSGAAASSSSSGKTNLLYMCFPFMNMKAKSGLDDDQNPLLPKSHMVHLNDIKRNSDIEDSIPTIYRPALIVRIIRARGLIAADNDGLSDPYAIVTLKSKRFLTKVVNKSLEPKWNETFVFGGDEDVEDYVCLDDILNISLMDQDIVSSDDLGMLEFPLFEIFTKTATTLGEDGGGTNNMNGNNLSENEQRNRHPQILPDNIKYGTKERWISLNPSPGMTNIRGDILLELTYLPANNILFDVPSKNRGISGATYPEDYGENMNLHTSSRTPLGVVHSNYPDYLPLYRNTVRARPILRLWVIQARDLAKKDLLGKSDPYCILRCRNKQYHTDIKYVNLNPYWGEVFEFGTDVDYILETDLIRIEVFDKDKINKDDPIGYLEFPIWCVMNRTDPEWYSLRNPGQPNGIKPSIELDDWPFVGEIRLKFEYLRPEIANPSSTNNLDGNLVFDEDYKKSQAVDASWDLIRDGFSQKKQKGLSSISSYNSFDSTTIKSFASQSRESSLSVSEGDTSFGIQRKTTRDFTTGINSHKSNDFGTGAFAMEKDEPAYVPPKYLPAKQVLSRVPSFKRYRGRIWQYEVQCTIIRGRRFILHKLHPGGRLHCSVHCGKMHEKKTAHRSRGAENLPDPVWYDDMTHVFKESDSEMANLPGIRRYDTLSITITHSSDSDKILGVVIIDIATLEDRLGFIDLDGSKLADWFPVYAVENENNEKGIGEAFELGNPSSGTPNHLVQKELGQILLNISLKPIRQTRLVEKKMITIKLGHAHGLLLPNEVVKAEILNKNDQIVDIDDNGKPKAQLRVSDLTEYPPANYVYALVQYGIQSYRTSSIKRSPGGDALFNEYFTFELLPDAEYPETSYIKIKVSIYASESNFFFGSYTMTATDVEERINRKLSGFMELEIEQEMVHTESGNLIDSDIMKPKESEEEKMITNPESMNLVLDSDKKNRDDNSESNEDNDSDFSDKSDICVASSSAHKTDLVKTLHHDKGSGFKNSKLARLTNINRGVSLPVLQTNWRRAFAVNEKGMILNSSIFLDARIMNVEVPINPIVGMLSIRLSRLKILTNDLNHHVRCVLSLGNDAKVATKVFSNQFNFTFPADDNTFCFPVRDIRSTLDIEVKELSDFDDASSLDGGSTISKVSISVFELIEHDAQKYFKLFYTNDKKREAFYTPIKLKLRLTSPSSNQRVRGTLSAIVSYNESSSAVLAPNPNPKPRQLAKLTPEAFGHEMKRFRDILGWIFAFSQDVSYILNWNNPPKSMAIFSICVFMCVLEPWTSRFLAIIPLVMVIHVVTRFVQRIDGRFAANYLKRSSTIGELDVKARLRITVLKATDILIDESQKKTRKRRGSIFSQINAISRRARAASAEMPPTTPLTINNDDDDAAATTVIAKLHLLSGVEANKDRALLDIGQVAGSSITNEVDWVNSQSRPRAGKGSVAIAWRMGKDLSFAKVPGFLRLVDKHVPRTRMIVVKVMNARIPISQTYDRNSIDKAGQPILTQFYVDLAAKSQEEDQTLRRPRKNSIGSEASAASGSLASKLISAFKTGFNHGNHQKKSRKTRAVPGMLLHNTNRYLSVWNQEFIFGIEEIIDVTDFLDISLRIQTRKIQQIKNATTFAAKSALRMSDSRDIEGAALQVPDKTDGGDGGEADSKADLNESGMGTPTHLNTNRETAIGVTARSVRSPGTKSFVESSNEIGKQQIYLSDLPFDRVVKRKIIIPLTNNGNDSPESSCELDLEFEWLGTQTSGYHQSISLGANSSDGHSMHETESKDNDDDENKDENDEDEDGVNESTERAHFFSWKANDSSVLIDVYEESKGGNKTDALLTPGPSQLTAKRRRFLGRATVKLSDLIKDSSNLDQPLVSKAIPLTIRYDGGAEDFELFYKRCIEQSEKILKKHNLRGKSKLIIDSYLDDIKSWKKGQKGGTPFSALQILLENISSSIATANETTRKSVDFITLEIIANELKRIKCDVVGSIHICGQITLPESNAEERLKKAIESKKTTKSGLKAKYDMMMREVNWFYTQLATFNDSMERLKNAFNWSHPRKTRIVLTILLFILGLFILLPSRFVAVFFIIFFFTEHFRPLGIMVVKAKHFLANVPTDDDISHVYATSTTLLELMTNESLENGQSTETITRDGKRSFGIDQESVALEAAQKMLEATIWRRFKVAIGMEQQHDTLDDSNPIDRINFNNTTISGHLHVLTRPFNLVYTTKQWNRQYFCVYKRELLNWLHKEDSSQLKPHVVFKNILSCRALDDNIEEAKEVLGEDYDNFRKQSFVIVVNAVDITDGGKGFFSLGSHYNEKSLASGANYRQSKRYEKDIRSLFDEKGDENGERKNQTLLSESTKIKSIYFITTSRFKRDRWIQELKSISS